MYTVIPRCDTFNFSLAGINNKYTSDIRNSEFHLYVEHSKANNSKFFVSIRELQVFKETKHVILELIAGSGWMKFDVHKEVASLIQSGNSNDTLYTFEQALVCQCTNSSTTNTHAILGNRLH